MATKTLNDPFRLAGTTLDGQYRVDAVVGEGGFGVVYRGFHLSLDQPIAIKALKVIDADDHILQEALFAKFKDEAKLLYTLSQASLNIVRSMDFGAVTTPSGAWAPYMILEWLDGRSLADDLDDRRQRGMRGRSVEEALALLEPAAEGLIVAHQRRVAHRDVKPANFFLLQTPEGTRLKVLDFGIAKIVRDDDKPGTKSAFASFTWLYAAPEQLDPRVGASGLATDVYAFALLLTEVLTDRPPVDGRDVVSIIRMSTDPMVRPTPRVRGANIPEALEVVCRRALAVDPKARFATMSEFWTALKGAARVAPSVNMRAAPPSTVFQGPLHAAPPPPTLPSQGQGQGGQGQGQVRHYVATPPPIHPPYSPPQPALPVPYGQQPMRPGAQPGMGGGYLRRPVPIGDPGWIIMGVAVLVLMTMFAGCVVLAAAC